MTTFATLTINFEWNFEPNLEIKSLEIKLKRCAQRAFGRLNKLKLQFRQFTD